MNAQSSLEAPLRTVVLKEIIENKFNFAVWLPMLAVLSVYYAWSEVPPAIFIVGIAVLPALAPGVLSAQEDRWKVTWLNRSLPISTKRLVLGKYLAGWLLAIVTCGYCVLFGLLTPSATIHPSSLLTLGNLCLIGTILAIGIALLLPFTLRFGFKGIIIMIIAQHLVLVLFLLVSALLFGQFNGDLIRALIGGVAQMGRLIHDRLGTVGSCLILGVVLLGLQMVSFCFSWALLRRRSL